MERMFSNIMSLRKDFGDSLQLANLILDAGATCHMTPEISYFISGSLVEMNKCIANAMHLFISTSEPDMPQPG